VPPRSSRQRLAIARSSKDARQAAEEEAAKGEDAAETTLASADGASVEPDAYVLTEDEREELLSECIRSDVGVQVAYLMLFASAPLGLAAEASAAPSLAGPAYFVLLAALGIYVGAHRSLFRATPAAINLEQAVAAPLFASGSLLLFFLYLKFFPNYGLETLLEVYFRLAGFIGVSGVLYLPLRILAGRELGRKDQELGIPQSLATGTDGAQLVVRYARSDVVAAVLSVGLVCLNAERPEFFWLANFITICLMTEILELFAFPKGGLWTAGKLLVGLLLYDIFWVFASESIFGENVMLSVATSEAFTGPTRLVFPVAADVESKYPFSILGAGDIIVPGLVVALMLRFDREQGHRRKSAAAPRDKLQSMTAASKDYFRAALLLYVAGLAVTIAINKLTGAAQPALLYLVPSVLGGSALFAGANGSLETLLSYRDPQRTVEREQP